MPQQVNGAWVSEDMFDVLGIAPARGRRFTAATCSRARADDYPRSRIRTDTLLRAADPIGQTLIVDGRSTAVIGVLPKGFRFPADEAELLAAADRSIAPTAIARQTYLRVMGRLADGATIAQVEQQMNAVAIDLEKQYPESNSGLARRDRCRRPSS